MRAVRGSVMKGYLAALERDLVPGARRVLEQLEPHHVLEVQRCSRIDWLPIEINFEATRTITRTLGVEGGEHFFYRLFAGLYEQTVFRSFVQGIRALGARDPGSYIKHAPRGYPMAFRGVGSVAIGERSDSHIEVIFRDMPRGTFDAELNWFGHTCASWSSAFDFTETRGRHRVVKTDALNGSARVLFEWEADEP